MGNQDYVLSLDIGTTTIKSFVYDQLGQIQGHSSQKVELLQPKPGWVEIDPEQLWSSVVIVLKEAIAAAKLTAQDIKCLGISTQRATFINWRRSTGKPFHNFITWKDVRADDLVQSWNNGISMKGIRAGSKFLHMLTRQKRFIVGGILKLQNKMVNMRLLWTLQNVPELMAAVKAGKNDVMFGTIDTWLLYKLSGDRKLHFSNISNIAASGLYDPFSLEYASWAFRLFGIPYEIMPEVVDDAGDHFGTMSKTILGSEIPIKCIMADQSASVFGQGCFKSGQLKMSLGSGSFLDFNTGMDVHASMKGLVPLVGWRIGPDLVYLAEGAYHDTSSVILWAQNMGLFKTPEESGQIAAQAPDTNVFFVPGFNGLQAPINDPNATAGFIGIQPETKPDVFLRSILESIAFGMKQLLEIMEIESPQSLTSETIMIDGGVSNNDFICQLISTLTGKNIERNTDVESSAFGVAFVAGLQSGIWKSKDDIHQLRCATKVFYPEEKEVEGRLDKYKKWVEACHRFKHWRT